MAGAFIYPGFPFTCPGIRVSPRIGIACPKTVLPRAVGDRRPRSP
jgi:hypothetical protein